jgi:hypothetical protein
MSHICFNDNLDIGLFLDVLSVETLSSIQGGLSDMSNDSSVIENVYSLIV